MKPTSTGARAHPPSASARPPRGKAASWSAGRSWRRRSGTCCGAAPAEPIFPGRGAGAAFGCCRPASSSGRNRRTACTTGSATAAEAAAGSSSACRRDDRRPVQQGGHRHQAVLPVTCCHSPASAKPGAAPGTLQIADFECLLDWWASARSWMQISCYVLGRGSTRPDRARRTGGMPNRRSIDLAGLKDALGPGPIVTAAWVMA